MYLPCFFALAALLLAPVAHAQKQPSLRQYLSIRAATGPSISPNGKEVAFLTNMTGSAQVWQVAAESGWPHQRTFFPSSVNAVHWSPAGNYLLAVADTDGNEQFQFHLIKPDGSEVIPLTNNPKVRHGFGGWSEDGKSIYYTSNERDPRYFDCYIMDIATRKARLAFQRDGVMDAALLSPDGKWLIASEATSNVNNDLFLVEVATGKAKHITHHHDDALYTPIGFASDGKSLLLATDQDRNVVNLARLDFASAKLVYLQTENVEVTGGALSRDGKTLALIKNSEGYADLSLWDAHTLRPLKTPKLPRGNVGLGGFSANGKRLALSINTPTRNTDVWILDVHEGRLRQTTFSSRAGIDTASFVEPTLIRYKSFDGLEVPAFLYLPQNAPQDHSLPVIVSVHGGPESQERPIFIALYQYYVSHGYAILAPNIRGSAGRGKRYLAMDNASKRWDALKDLAALADWTATHPALNPKKVAIMGGSYGGFATLAMLAHYPDKFAAGIDLFGIADFKTFLENTAPYRRPLRAAEYGDPIRDSEFLDAISPARHADKITSPLLVIQGANDPRVPESESAQIVKKVKDRGGVADYLLFPDEGHGIAKLSNRVRAYERIVEFLNRYLRR